MRYKATLVMGIAAGYILGARAGRQRYEQIKRLNAALATIEEARQRARRSRGETE